MPAASVSDFFPLLPSSPPSECVVCSPLDHRLAAPALSAVMDNEPSLCSAPASHSGDAGPCRLTQSCSSSRLVSRHEAQHMPYPADSTSDHPEGTAAMLDPVFVGVSPLGLVSCFPSCCHKLTWVTLKLHPQRTVSVCNPSSSSHASLSPPSYRSDDRRAWSASEWPLAQALEILEARTQGAEDTRVDQAWIQWLHVVAYTPLRHRLLRS
jgi:hypothetical protein